MSFTASMITGDGTITAFTGGESYTVNPEHLNYLSIVKAFKEGDSERFIELTNPSSQIEKYLHVDVSDFNDRVGSIELRAGVIHYDNKIIDNVLVERVYSMMRQGYSFRYMLYFLNNLMMNPSFSSVEQLYRFLEHECMPITSDGYFLGYKSVTTHYGEDFTDVHGREVTEGDLVDKYTGKVRNNIGDVPCMPRNQVDDDPHSACGRGYHAGALSYSGPDGWYNGSSDTIILVKIHPANAVSVPHDSSHGKLRTCSYEVVEVYRGPLTKPVYDTTGDNLYDNDVDHDEWYDDDEEETEVFTSEVVDIDDLEEGDEIRLDYTDRHGKTKRRHVKILDQDDNADWRSSFQVELMDGDPSYDVDLGFQIRKFKFNGMTYIDRY